MKGGDKVKNGAEKTEELFKKYGDEILRTCMLILRNCCLTIYRITTLKSYGLNLISPLLNFTMKI